jgi:hypothetical protein
MKIKVYNIETITPATESEYQFYCTILDVPVLRNGNVQVVGDISHTITKSELNKIKKASHRFFDREKVALVDGVLLLNSDKKLFVKYV